jgi:hypothetical protein
LFRRESLLRCPPDFLMHVNNPANGLMDSAVAIPFFAALQHNDAQAEVGAGFA